MIELNGRTLMNLYKEGIITKDEARALIGLPKEIEENNNG